MNQKIENIINMIGCNRDDFMSVIGENVDITMSTGSYYSDYWIFSGGVLIAKYTCKGERI
jgi:hypothetical protein